MGVHLVFLTPIGAIAGACALAPLVAAVLRERRHRSVRRVLGLGNPRRRGPVASALSASAVIACLAAAATQPAVRTSTVRRTRSDAQAYVVVDVTRSMLARRAPGAPTRFERAVALAQRIRARLPEVPIGVASLSDWLLPHALPTTDPRTFAAALTTSIAVGRPATRFPSPNATDFSTLTSLARGNYFGPGVRHRLAFVLSDGESRFYPVGTTAAALARGGIRLVVVRIWHADERVFVRGRRDPGYRPDPKAAAQLTRLAGPLVFSEHDLGGVVSAARAILGRGPLEITGRRDRTVPLGQYAALAAILPLAFLLRRR